MFVEEKQKGMERFTCNRREREREREMEREVEGERDGERETEWSETSLH